jgi:hypothetical protein
MKTTSLRTALISLGVGSSALCGLAYAAGSLEASTEEDLTAALWGEAFA